MKDDRGALAVLKSRLASRRIPFKKLDDGLTVVAKGATGFDATIHIDGGGWNVQLDAWHEEF